MPDKANQENNMIGLVKLQGYVENDAVAGL